ncbi:MAG: nickel pincer cofactor biosynthesis protein LarC [Thermodesulfovibrionales bacterium]
MKTAYLDCFSGISGDMCLGALLDAGVPARHLRKELEKLPVKGIRISARTVARAGLRATQVRVGGPSRPPLRRLRDVASVIRKSALSPEIKARGLAIFETLFEAEARAHGQDARLTHLHELGAVDCMVDVMGTLICLERLGVGRVLASPVNLGWGEVETAHGTYPVPAPATAEILRGAPVYSSGTPYELTTPTGAAILRGTAEGFCGLPLMSVEAAGLGAGATDVPGRPNVLRVFIGEAPEAPAGEVAVMETNIDDMNPEIYGHVMERLFAEGALDVHLTQVIMKKGRPGVKLTVLCDEGRRLALAGVLLSETTSIGVRFWRAERSVLERETRTVETEYGRIRLKEARLGGRALRAAPEYEDCRKAALKHGVTVLEVYRAALGG